MELRRLNILYEVSSLEDSSLLTSSSSTYTSKSDTSDSSLGYHSLKAFLNGDQHDCTHPLFLIMHVYKHVDSCTMQKILCAFIRVIILVITRSFSFQMPSRSGILMRSQTCLTSRCMSKKTRFIVMNPQVKRPHKECLIFSTP